jgi:hypothetical protein
MRSTKRRSRRKVPARGAGGAAEEAADSNGKEGRRSMERLDARGEGGAVKGAGAE